MSAAEEDTELRDLLVQTLEGSGVLNKIKAELRAAVFLALEEQEKVENKAPLVNESLKKFLNTKDGRLVCSLVTEFLQFFHLDFTLAVFQPETSMLNGTQNRQSLARELGIVEVDGARGSPLLMELLKQYQQKNKDELPEIASKSSQKLSESNNKNSSHSSVSETKQVSNLNNKFNEALEKSDLGLDEEDNEGDSFFDDPIPEPGKGYSWRKDSSKITGDFTDITDAPIPEPDKGYGWRKDSSKTTGGFTDLTDAPILKAGQNSFSGAPMLKETDKPRRNLSSRDLKTVTGKIVSLEFGNGEEEDYMDDFNSTSHRSDKSEFSIGEEIEEDFSAEDFNPSDHVDDFTQDHSLSHASVHVDYMEDVA